MSLGARIRRRRRQQKMTQEQLADISGVTVNYISKIERGLVPNLSAKTLSRMAAGLSVSMNQLLNGSDSDETLNARPNQKVLASLLNNMPDDVAEAYSKNFINLIHLKQNKV